MSIREMTAANFAEMIRKGTVLVDCWAPWCGPCRAFAPIFEAAAGRHPEVTFAKVNTEREQKLARAFRIHAIPTLLAFRDGILVFREAGLMPAVALENLLKQVAHLDMAAVRRKLAASEVAS